MAGNLISASCFVFDPTREHLVKLLPRLLDGEESTFVHRADVCSAAPADLVRDLDPAPGTDKGDGNGGEWYIWCPKRYVSDVKTDGNRLRTIANSEERWHGEAGPKKKKVKVVLDDGRTVVGEFRTFTYDAWYKTPPEDKPKFKRFGWSMVECSINDPRYDHVLCKVYRPRRGKASSSGSKRKAASGDHPEAPPARSSPQQLQENRLAHDAPVMPVQDVDQLGYVHEGPQPGAGAVHGGDTAGAGISMEEDRDGVYFEELPSLLNPTDYEQLASLQVAEEPLATPPDFQSFDNFFQEGLQQPGTGPVHGGDSSNLLQELAGIDDGGLQSLLNQTDNDPLLPWPESMVESFFDDDLFGPK